MTYFPFSIHYFMHLFAFSPHRSKLGSWFVCAREGFTFDIVHRWYKLLPPDISRFQLKFKRKKIQLPSKFGRRSCYPPSKSFLSLHFLLLLLSLLSCRVLLLLSYNSGYRKIIYHILTPIQVQFSFNVIWLVIMFLSFYISARLYSLYPKNSNTHRHIKIPFFFVEPPYTNSSQYPHYRFVTAIICQSVDYTSPVTAIQPATTSYCLQSLVVIRFKRIPLVEISLNIYILKLINLFARFDYQLNKLEGIEK